MQKTTFIIIFLLLTCFKIKAQEKSPAQIYFRAGTGLIKEFGIYYSPSKSNLQFSAGYIHGLSILGKECTENFSHENIYNYLRRGGALRIGYEFNGNKRFNFTPQLLFRYQKGANETRHGIHIGNCYSAHLTILHFQNSLRKSATLLFFADYKFKKLTYLSPYIGVGLGIGSTEITTFKKIIPGETPWSPRTIETGLNEKYTNSNPFFLFDLGVKIYLKR